MKKPIIKLLVYISLIIIVCLQFNNYNKKNDIQINNSPLTKEEILIEPNIKGDEEQNNTKIDELKKDNKEASKKTTIYKVNIPTYNQKKAGYPRGCEGVSLYMALKGKGYLKGVSIKDFMDTMPISPDDNPNNGYAGDPTKGKNTEINKSKRTTIHPSPLTDWTNQFGKAKNLQGSSINKLKKELRKGNPIIVWMTSGFRTAKYTKYSWGTTVSNNHALCLVGYNEKTDEYLVNDCSSKNTGEYWVSKSKFEKSYNYRKYAVVIY
jgi:uncharacterized protein YvpB